jgi:hypothetical protein
MPQQQTYSALRSRTDHPGTTSRNSQRYVRDGHLACVGVRQERDKEMTMIAALKHHYEYYHAADLTALKKLYEYHAENCVKAAELTEDTQQREEYLKLARQWTEAADPL